LKTKIFGSILSPAVLENLPVSSHRRGIIRGTLALFHHPKKGVYPECDITHCLIRR
jgi:hypothetical protein